MSVVNTNYAATYGTWVKQYDASQDKNFWAPSSGVVAASFATNDSVYQPWFAPAGFTRGLITNALEIALRPNQKQRDQFYKIGVNPIAWFPGDGYVIFGQKTLQAKPSAFDRINVRRMFLYLEKAVRKTVKYFVFEPNTFATRQNIIAVLTPIFQRVKSTQGCYDYLIVCDDRNNPPAVIDNNEMVIDIYIKPVRFAEFILVNFYATRTDQNFGELVG
jgi:phage tail sheath protein FI